LGTIHAYASAFDRMESNRPFLVLKVGGYAGNEHLLADIRLAADRAGVRLITETLSQKGMDALISASDIFVSLHRAEGFGLVVAQAMLAGKPTIVTDWSGTRDFTDAMTACLVPAKEVAVSDPQGIYPPIGVWAEPDIEAAVTWMRRLAFDPTLRRDMGDRAAAKARTALSVDAWWRNVGADFRRACGVTEG
jgi:glycosyltransferase involved in cell wall biosynthesis